MLQLCPGGAQGGELGDVVDVDALPGLGGSAGVDRGGQVGVVDRVVVPGQWWQPAGLLGAQPGAGDRGLGVWTVCLR